MANVETNEAMYPIRYLFRRRMPDSGGAGEFRGGTGGEYAMVPHHAPTGEVGFVISGKGVDFPMSHGLAGGYPGSPGRYEICRGAQPAVGGTGSSYRLAEIGGTHEVVSFGVYHVHNEDVFYVRWNGGGGLGDPLQRDPQAVARDVAEGVVSPLAARALYGVNCAPSGEVDVDATRRQRDEMRADRMQTNVRAPARMHCTVCCGASTSTNGGTVAVHERLMSEIVPSYTTGPLTTLSEIVCPQCGALLDAEVTMQGAGPLLNDQSPEGRQ
jgi:N-methylhydantoinase B